METTSRAPIAEVIAAALGQRGMTIGGLSTATGIPHVTLRRRIATGRGMRVDELEVIAAALGTTAAALMTAAEQAG